MMDKDPLALGFSGLMGKLPEAREGVARPRGKFGGAGSSATGFPPALTGD